MRTYVYTLGRDTIICVTRDINHIYKVAMRYSIGEPLLGGWRRIQVWENNIKVNDITVNGNSMVKMPKDKGELWQMLNE